MGETGIQNFSGIDRHVPVMPEEIIFWLRPKAGDTFVDCTVGFCGHASRILEACAPDGIVVGIDRDPAAIEAGKTLLKRFGGRAILIKGNFVELKRHLSDRGIGRVSGVLFDLGVSSLQIDEAVRGFSFQVDGPLDMRMDQTTGMTAADIVNATAETDLADMIYRFGEERYSRRIARAIVRARASRPLETTAELASVIKSAVPAQYRYGRIHCATRTFLALRIVVNQEMQHLEPALRDAAEMLEPGGRICVISFHSLEDRIVKHTFRSLAAKSDGELQILTKRPQLPTDEEVKRNPRSRSAKLRVIQRIEKEGHA